MCDALGFWSTKKMCILKKSILHPKKKFFNVTKKVFFCIVNKVFFFVSQEKFFLGNFTRVEWNHLLRLFNISHFRSTFCSEGVSKRTQQDSGEERVTAKSRPMMSLIARAPLNSVIFCIRKPGEEKLWSPWSAEAEEDDRTEQRVVSSDANHESVHHHKLLKARIQHAIQGGTMTKLGLLKSGKLMN